MLLGELQEGRRRQEGLSSAKQDRAAHADAYWAYVIRPIPNGTSNMKTNIQLGKPFQCQECGNRFSARQALEQHRLIHTNEKPLVCNWPGCDQTFRQQSALSMSPFPTLFHLLPASILTSHQQCIEEHTQKRNPYTAHTVIRPSPRARTYQNTNGSTRVKGSSPATDRDAGRVSIARIS